MDDSLVNPQEIFRSHLPVGALLLVIFVPSRDRDGQLIDQEYWVDEVRRHSAHCFVVQLPIHAVEESGVTTHVVAHCSEKSLASFFHT